MVKRRINMDSGYERINDEEYYCIYGYKIRIMVIYDAWMGGIVIVHYSSVGTIQYLGDLSETELSLLFGVLGTL